MFAKKLARHAAVAAAAFGLGAGLALAVAPTASANDMDWTLRNPDGVILATGRADDAANRIYVRDRAVNDRNVRLDVWRVGNKSGTHVRCRDNVAEDGRGENCALIWGEDTHLAGELCEMNGSTATRCTSVKDFYN